MTARRAIIVAVTGLLVSPVARSGHELPVYPSYYPHEIEIAALAPDVAAERLGSGKLHAYVGGAPAFAGAAPVNVGSVESLGSLLVVRLNPDTPLVDDQVSACATAAAVVRDIEARADGRGLIVHPYPVTPFHGDYLIHADRADRARHRLLSSAAAPPADPKVRAEGALARGLVRAGQLVDAGPWDAAIDEVNASALIADATVALNGWLGPRWVRSGWFHAHRLLAGSIIDPAQKLGIDAIVQRLQGVTYDGNVERINLERELVSLLLSGCRAMVAGYTIKREYYNAEFSAGIENIAFDALEGFTSPMFLRTAKLKDFPWNGWLQLGLEARSASAWNPIAGFTDPFGRLIWFAIADPAVIPSPYETTWTLNRFSEVETSPRQ